MLYCDLLLMFFIHREAKVQNIYLSGSLKASFSAYTLFGLHYFTCVELHSSLHHRLFRASLSNGLCGCTMALKIYEILKALYFLTKLPLV